MFEAKIQKGKRVSLGVPYGYLRDSYDKQQLLKITTKILAFLVENVYT
jgi:hypothetical protein